MKLYYNVDSLEDLTNRQKLEVLGGEMEFKKLFGGSFGALRSQYDGSHV